MPLEFPEDALEAIAQDCEQAARDWAARPSQVRSQIAQKWARKAATIRQAIDAYRERVNAPPITRRQKFAAMVDELTAKMTPVDHKARAAGDR